MRFVVLAASAAVFLILYALLYKAGRKADLVSRRLDAIRGSERDYGDDELKKSFSERVLAPAADKMAGMLRSLTSKNPQKKPNKGMEKLEKQLKAASIPLTAREFTMAKSLLSLLFLGGGAVAYLLLPLDPMIRLLLLLLMLCIPVYGPKFYLNNAVKKRKEAIVRDLPDVMDLLVVSVEAGLGLDAAINRLYEKDKCVVLSELAGAVRDIQMGVPRKISFREMADRCDVKQLSTFVSSLVQAEQLGVSMKNVLATQSERLRVERRQRIQAKAQKAPIKIMLPTVGFIFPVMFIILLGPAAMNLLTMF